MVERRKGLRGLVALLFAGAALLALYTTLWDAPSRVLKAGL